MPQFVSQLISIGGQSLEKEDQFLQSVSERKGEVGGVLRVRWDCYYQYVFGRAIITQYDSELRFNNDDRCFAELRVQLKREVYFFVMEHWKEGEPLTRLKQQVEQLAKYSNGAYLLVFSANPCGQTEGNVHLVDGLAGAENRASVHCFRTKDAKGDDYEFWIGGWRVPGKRSAVPHLGVASNPRPGKRGRKPRVAPQGRENGADRARRR